MNAIPERVTRRLLSRFDVNEEGCWISRYSIGSHGYSQIGWSANGRTHMVLGHRAAWMALRGPIPPEMTIDHLCKTKRCINPTHMRLLDNFENGRRGGRDWPLGQCVAGHGNDSLRTYVRLTRGVRRRYRYCIECKRIHAARSRARARNREVVA